MGTGWVGHWTRTSANSRRGQIPFRASTQSFGGTTSFKAGWDRLYDSAVRSSSKSPSRNLSRKAFEPIETSQNVGHGTTLPSQDVRRSSIARSRHSEAAVLDPSVFSESIQEHSRYAPLSAFGLEGAARKAKIFMAQGSNLDTTASARAPDAVKLRSPPAREGLRQSEESTGATDMTSVRATQDSLSNGSHDSVLSTSKSVLRKRTERLAIITKDLANGAEAKHPSLSVDLSRITAASTVVMPVSQTYAFPGPHLPHASGVRGYISQLETQLSRLSGPDVPGDSPGDSQTSSTGHYTASPRPTERHSASQRHPGPSPLSSTYFETHSQRSRPSSQRPRVPVRNISSRSGLSFIIPMFNQDCSLNPSVTAGQMEINLLRMIEAERQKCAMLGTPWDHQQIYALSWVIRSVQSMVSSECQSNIAIPPDDLNRHKLNGTQFDRVFERVLSSLQDDEPSSVNLRHTPPADISMLNSSRYEPPSTGTSPSWAHAPLPSEISLSSAQSLTGRNASTPVYRNAPIMPMYLHPHRSAVSLQTTTSNLQSSPSYRRQALSKPGTAGSATSKTSSALSPTLSRHASSLLLRSRPRPFASSPQLYQSPITPATPASGGYFSAPGSALTSRPSSAVHHDLMPAGPASASRDAPPPPYRSISDD